MGLRKLQHEELHNLYYLITVISDEIKEDKMGMAYRTSERVHKNFEVCTLVSQGQLNSMESVGQPFSYTYA